MARCTRVLARGPPDLSRQGKDDTVTNLPTRYAAARIATFLSEHFCWSVFWDKQAGLWRAAEDDPDSDLHIESPDADVVIGYMAAHS
jgi:hypothetical protein